MKRYVYLTLLLAMAGAVISGVLLFQHYLPEADMGFLSCGDGFSNPCASVTTSAYGSLFGIPLAAWGIFSYLVILFLLLIADYAGEVYTDFARALTLVIASLSLAGDVVLGGLMASLGQFCHLCFTTYVINAGLVITSVLWTRSAGGSFTGKISGPIKKFLAPSEKNEHHRASLASLFIALFFLGFSVFSTNMLISMKNPVEKIPDSEIVKFINDFMTAPVEKPELPDSGLVLGNENAKVTIVAFTDFLCSACYEFFKVEKQLLARFPNDIRVIYFNYPLDKACNTKLNGSMYPGSCSASKAMIAAQKKGFFERYVTAHFKEYKTFKRSYDMSTALKILNNAALEKEFGNIALSAETGAIIAKHIEAAEKAHVNATPTLFINGRKLVGVPPVEMMEALVKKILSAEKNPKG